MNITLLNLIQRALPGERKAQTGNEKGILMNLQSKGFHPITRAFAYIGAFICAFFSLTIFISSVFAFTDIFNLLAGFGMTVLTSMLAWAFWYAGKAGKNPFIVRPFSSPE